MRKSILFPVIILTFILAVIFLYRYWQQQNNGNILSSGTIPLPTPTPIIVPNGSVSEIGYKNKKYLILSVPVERSSEIQLIANFSEKLNGERIVNEYNCDTAINGGFYLENSKPLGLFISGGKTWSKEVKSSIANTFIQKDLAGDIKFLGNAPKDNRFTDFIFQTGPYITAGNIKLRLIRDEPARRSLLGKDRQGNLYFINVISQNDITGGPYLSDVPVIFGQLNQQTRLQIEELVNLDGGSASFFFSRDENSAFELSEWNPVGSLLCLINK